MKKEYQPIFKDVKPTAFSQICRFCDKEIIVGSERVNVPIGRSYHTTHYCRYHTNCFKEMIEEMLGVKLEKK